MRSLLIFRDDGQVVGTLSHMVALDDGQVIGLLDFGAHEDAGGRMRDIIDQQQYDEPIPDGVARQILGRSPEPGEGVALPPDHPWRQAHDRVAGSATWPEWLGGAAYDFRVELDPNPGKARARIAALVHKKSGHRRERAAIEAAVQERINEKKLEAKKRGDEQRAFFRRQGMKAQDVDLIQDPEVEAADIRDIVGGPGRPLLIDENGRTRPRVKSERPQLPVVKRAQGHPR